jgi:hypothetical protein
VGCPQGTWTGKTLRTPGAELYAAATGLLQMRETASRCHRAIGRSWTLLDHWTGMSEGGSVSALQLFSTKRLFLVGH